MDWVLLHQFLSLLSCIAYHTAAALLSLPAILLYYLGLRSPTGQGERDSSVTYYEGYVTHSRKAPKENSFKYAVRTAVIDMEHPPAWFKSQAKDHMTAEEARKFANTRGPIKLLSTPDTAGYSQNPISVYYCYESDRKLHRCIAEVTNTPWGERVTFVFDPSGDSVQKCLHVSPFMDMQNTWHLLAPDPDATLKLVVRATHPELGNYFSAELLAVRSSQPTLSNEEAGILRLLRFGFMPHRVAILIYWQAIKLIWKGVPFYSPPSPAKYQSDLIADASKHSHPKNGVTRTSFCWRAAKSYPWNAS